MTNSLGNKEKMAANIKRYLSMRGMTMKDLADELGVPYSTVLDWCKGATYPRIDKIEMMANFFGCSKVDLVEDPEDVKAEMLERVFGDDVSKKTLFKLAEKATPKDLEVAIKILDSLVNDYTDEQ